VLVASDRSVRIALSVVTLGVPDRLRRCLDALLAHETRHDFTVTVVVNADTSDGTPPRVDLPVGVDVDVSSMNLGWPGGLQRARERTGAELLVWVQDDMTPEPGWLDALVEAADDHPHVGAFGSVRVDERGDVLVSNAGDADPPDDIARWNDTDRTAERLPTAVTTYDWVTSRGMLTRSRAFDDVGGPDPRIWPLAYADKEYCTHLRCHGWDVALVPAARVQHTMLQSAPGPFRIFLFGWREEWFNRRWSAPLVRLAGRSSAVVEHPCADWRTASADPLEAAVGAEASRLTVPLARALVREAAAAEEVRLQMLADLQAHADRLEALDDVRLQMLADLQAHADRLAAALVQAEADRDRARLRTRRLRRRLRRQAQPAGPPPGRWRRVVQALRERLR